LTFCCPQDLRAVQRLWDLVAQSELPALLTGLFALAPLLAGPPRDDVAAIAGRRRVLPAINEPFALQGTRVSVFASGSDQKFSVWRTARSAAAGPAVVVGIGWDATGDVTQKGDGTTERVTKIWVCSTTGRLLRTPRRSYA